MIKLLLFVLFINACTIAVLSIEVAQDQAQAQAVATWNRLKTNFPLPSSALLEWDYRSLRSGSTPDALAVKYYNETFGHCSADYRACYMSYVRPTVKVRKLAPRTKKIPWWFQTLLRDNLGAKTFIQGPWHNLNSPSLEICAIEKIASTEWRQTFCHLNRANEADYLPQRDCNLVNAIKRAKVKEVAEKKHKFVVLRDPLERFLSAYINKCEVHIKREPHCKPGVIFKNQTDNELIEGLDKHSLFAAYVDTMPLKWDVHFMPQSFFCWGLSKTLNDYDFVLYMGPNYWSDLKNLSSAINVPHFEDAMNLFFKMDTNLNSGLQNSGTETHAASRVNEYYTPYTVRRILQYFSVDYVDLNLPLPLWAVEMLKSDSIIRK